MTLAWLAAAWLAGMADAALGAQPWALALSIGAVALAAAFLRRDARVVVYALTLPVVFVTAAARYDHARPHLAGDDAARFNDGPAIRLRVVVRDDPTFGDTSQRFAVDVRSVEERGEWRDASGGVLVRSGPLPRYAAGDVLELEGKLDSPPTLDRFDYADYLARKGILSVMEYPKATSTGHEAPSLLRAATLAVRRRLSHALALSLPEPQASLAQGVLLGRRSALPADVTERLNITNTSHLVVVSGENVVLVSSYATIALAWLAGRRRAMALSILAVLAYATLVGASPPVMRATIMGILVVVATLAGRPSNGLVSILLAAAVMAGLDPPVVRDVSFQLSFAATAGIVYLASPLRRWIIELIAMAVRRDEVPRLLGTFFAEPLAVTLAAIIATTPLLALNFGRVSIVAVPANLLVVPAFPLILGASLIAALGGMLPHGRLIFGAPAYYALTYWLDVARWFASVPGAAARIDGYDARWASVTYALVAALALAFLRYFAAPVTSRLAESRPFVLARLRAPVVVGVPLGVLVGGAAWTIWPSPPHRLEVTVLDVGQGDAILIRTPRGDDILVDGGPGRAALRGLGDELSWHDRSVELMILTHPQADHLLGLLDVLDRYDVRRVLAGPGSIESTGYREWQRAVKDEARTIETASRGMKLDLGNGALLEVLGPGDREATDAQLNNTSAVVRISWREVSFLLTGDIEARAEDDLVRSGADLQATVLKVPHHGSRTSSTAAFLEAVRPDVSVISVGRDNVFGHPAPDIVDRLRRYGDVYETSESGAVHFSTDGRELSVETAR